MSAHSTQEVEKEKVFAVLMNEHKRMKRSLDALDGVPERVGNIEDDIREIKTAIAQAVRWVFGLIGALMVSGIVSIIAYMISH